jgi:hypothetical protein
VAEGRQEHGESLFSSTPQVGGTPSQTTTAAFVVNGDNSHAPTLQSSLETASIAAEADADSNARERTLSFASATLDNPPPAPVSLLTSATAPHGEVPDSHPSSPLTDDDFELPFQLPVPTSSLPPPPKPTTEPVPAPHASTSTLPTPLTSAALALHPQHLDPSSSSSAYPPAPASDSASTARGRAGRFLPKPPGTTQKAQRAAARAARVDGSANGSEAPHLTQRQQREIAKKAREETQKMQAEKEKELAKTRERERLFVCDKCFKYFAAAATYTVHTVRLCFTLASSFSDLTVNGR